MTSSALLVTAPLTPLLPRCCGTSTRTKAPWVLPVEHSAVNPAAGLTCAAWSCLHDSKIRHSQWFNQSDLLHVSRINDPDAALGVATGRKDASFFCSNPSVELWTDSGGYGRFAVAARPIKTGDCALRATAFAVVARQPRQRCHWCFAALKKKALQCGDCRFARYCSRECLEADQILHNEQCQALRRLVERDNGSRMNQLDLETIRLGLAVLSMERLIGNTGVLRRLAVNNQSEKKGGKDVNEVVKIIADEMPSVSALHIQQTLRIVQCNAHPMYLDGRTICGVGVFPEAAMTLNHSCVPNVVPSFDPQTRTLSFHAIADIPRCHAIEYSYIDILQSWHRRQQMLQDGFGFQCICARCEEEKTDADDIGGDGGAEEKRVMAQLLEMEAAKMITQTQLDGLYTAHRSFFERNHEAAFGFRMLEVRHAHTRRDWLGVMTAAQQLIAMWRSLDLPELYPTMESLQWYVMVAATRAGQADKASHARECISNIHCICGYKSGIDEASIVG